MKSRAKKRWFALIILLLCAVVIGLFYWNGQKKMQNDEGYLVKYSLLFTPVSITPLIDTEDARFDLNASRPIAKGDLKWRDALLVAHRVNSNMFYGHVIVRIKILQLNSYNNCLISGALQPAFHFYSFVKRIVFSDRYPE